MRKQVLLLVIVALSGSSGAAMADMHNIAPISVELSSEVANFGDTIRVFGDIKEMNPDLTGAVTIQVFDPNGVRVAINQVTPDSGGSYSASMIVGGGLWSVPGEYRILVTYLSDDNETLLTYAGPLTCPDGQELVGNMCQDIICATGQELVGNECQDIMCPTGQELIGNDCQDIICATGQELVGNECQDIICADGFRLEGNSCIPNPVCGPGTELVDGVCQIIQVQVPPPPPPVEEPVEEPIECDPGMELVDGECQEVAPAPSGGGCLIATAAFGTELAPQVQYLREIRDDRVMSTDAGTSFMTGFNNLYYMVSPTIADLEREHPIFREFVKFTITPMLASLSIMELSQEGSEISVLGTGILVILLNVMMYLVAPTLLGFKAYGKIRARRRE